MKTVVLLTSILALTGCGGDPPCETLDAPSEAMRQAVIEGAEVEIEMDGQWGKAECVVVIQGKNARWADQTDE